jgi:hypothetical protein
MKDMAYKRMSAPRMEPHANGVVIKWDDIHENPVPGQTYTNSQYKEQSEVYKIDHDADDKGGPDLDKAMDRYKELILKHSKEKANGK